MVNVDPDDLLMVCPRKEGKTHRVTPARDPNPYRFLPPQIEIRTRDQFPKRDTTTTKFSCYGLSTRTRHGSQFILDRRREVAPRLFGPMASFVTCDEANKLDPSARQLLAGHLAY